MNKRANESFSFDLLIGGSSAAITRAGLASMRRIKLRRLKRKISFKRVIELAKKIGKEESFNSLWKGHLGDIITDIPAQALSFGLNDKYKTYLNPFNPKTEFWQFFLGNLASGGAAGATTALIFYPIDTARANLGEEGKRQFSGLFDCITKLGRRELYKGFGVSVMGTMFYRSIYFGGYDTLKKTIPMPNNNIVFKLVIAQFVTVVADLASYPFNIVRWNLMKRLGEGESVGTIDCFKKILREEGTRAFFQGGLAHVFRGAGSSLVLVCYDELHGYFSPNSTKRDW